MRNNYEGNNKNIYVMTCRLYVSYVYTKLHWIWPVHYADLRISADATEIQNGCPDEGVNGVQKIIMLYFIPSERT